MRRKSFQAELRNPSAQGLGGSLGVIEHPCVLGDFGKPMWYDALNSGCYAREKEVVEGHFLSTGTLIAEEEAY